MTRKNDKKQHVAKKNYEVGLNVFTSKYNKEKCEVFRLVNKQHIATFEALVFRDRVSIYSSVTIKALDKEYAKHISTKKNEQRPHQYHRVYIDDFKKLSQVKSHFEK